MKKVEPVFVIRNTEINKKGEPLLNGPPGATLTGGGRNFAVFRIIPVVDPT